MKLNGGVWCVRVWWWYVICIDKPWVYDVPSTYGLGKVRLLRLNILKLDDVSVLHHVAADWAVHRGGHPVLVIAVRTCVEEVLDKLPPLTYTVEDGRCRHFSLFLPAGVVGVSPTPHRGEGGSVVVSFTEEVFTQGPHSLITIPRDDLGSILPAHIWIKATPIVVDVPTCSTSSPGECSFPGSRGTAPAYPWRPRGPCGRDASLWSAWWRSSAPARPAGRTERWRGPPPWPAGWAGWQEAEIIRCQFSVLSCCQTGPLENALSCVLVA